jgi:molecular chaperone IbpA
MKDPFGTFTQDIDRMFNAPLQKTNYPPYNVKKVSENHFVLEFAIAGFSRGELDISVEKNILTLKGEKLGTDDEYLYKGIATRKFTRSFSLPEYFEVTDASTFDGILYIDLHNNMPEDLKPKQIEIR